MTARIQDHGDVVVVTMAWTQRRNAIGPPEADELAAAIRTAGERARSAVVLTGDGAFSAGGDLRAIAEISRTHTREQIRDIVYSRFQGVVGALRECPVPTLAAVDGAAVGLGADLMLACDLRLIGPRGWVAQGWAKAGLVAGTGGIALLSRIRAGLVWELLAAGDRVTAAECARLGIGEATAGAALDTALHRAAAFASIDPDVLRHYVELERAASWPAPEHFAEVASIQSGLIASDRFRAFADRVLAKS